MPKPRRAPHVPSRVRGRIDELLDQWQLLAGTDPPGTTDATWRLLERLPEAWLRALQKFNSAVGEHLQEHPAEAPAAWLPFYFRTLGFAQLADAFGDHSLCEWDAQDTMPGRLVLRNIEPGPFIAPRIRGADALVLFSATLHPPAYYTDLLGLPEDTWAMDIPCPFRPEQLPCGWCPSPPVAMTAQHRWTRWSGCWRGSSRATAATTWRIFSSFDYLDMALAALHQRYPEIPVWAQQRQMAEADRQAFLRQFDEAGRGIGFAVLGGAFGEGVDLPGRRLIGAFIATLGLPQFDPVNAAICERMQTRFGRGHDYTYVYPGIQKVVQAAGRVIRTDADTGCVVLLDARYRERRYRSLLPGWWRLAMRRPARRNPRSRSGATRTPKIGANMTDTPTLAPPPPAAQRAPRPAVQPVLEQLAALYPALFGAVFLPLKRGIFQDLLAAHPRPSSARP
jgi:DNA excision repair protein ERCC-2